MRGKRDLQSARRRIAATAVCVTLGIVGAACGAAGGGDARVTAAAGSVGRDPHGAAVAYAACLRRHGVPHPDPDRLGSFHLTPADERRLRGVSRAWRQAADRACFHYLRGTVRTKPLSRHARTEALEVLEQVADCMRGYGYELGPAVVRNLPRGRAFFGFSHPDPVPPQRVRDNHRVEHVCERRVDLAGKLDRIIAADRGTPNLGDL
jgi:hypothetical protein